ncbi:MAG TPA: hypothetical protein VGJ86_23335 [Acidimicrobiales bacterium]
MGQLSDPYNQCEDDGVDLTISGLPEDLEDPEPDELEEVTRSGPDEPDGDFDDDNDVVVDTEDGEVIDAEVSDEADDDAESDDSGEDGDDDGEDEDDEEVAYDLTEWDDEHLDALFDQLDAADLAYLWDGEELFIQASDEQAVDEVLEKVSNPDALAADDDSDGGGWLLGELFVAADRLQHDPEEHETVATLLQLATAAEESEPPYGLSEAEWEQLKERVTALATALEQDKPDADTVIEAAKELRSHTRPYV